MFTLPASIGAIAYQNKAKVYGMLFSAAAETLTTIAADPKHLGAAIGLTAVLHTWGQSLDHHPPFTASCLAEAFPPTARGGLREGRASSCPFGCCRGCSGVCSWSVWRQLHAKGELQFFSDLAGLTNEKSFKTYLAPLRKNQWVVYAKRPFAGPSQVLAYLARYTHRVAIANSRLHEVDDNQVSFRWKNFARRPPEIQGHAARPRASSCAGSCSMCSPMASIAFATMACSPTATVLRKFVLCRKLLEMPPAARECIGDAPTMRIVCPRTIRRPAHVAVAV